MSTQTDLSMDVVGAEGFVEGTVEGTVAGAIEAETHNEAIHVVTRDRLPGEDHPHHAVSAISMFPVAEDEDVETVVTFLANAVALFQTIALHLLHLVVHAAHPRQIDQERHHAVDRDDLLQLVAPDLRLAAFEGRHHHDIEGEDKGHGLPATIIEDYLGIHHDLSLHQ